MKHPRPILVLTSSLLLAGLAVPPGRALPVRSGGPIDLWPAHPSHTYWYRGEPLPSHSFRYELRNRLDDRVPFTASVDQGWVDVEPKSGLVGALSKQALGVQLTPAAAALPPGKHAFTLTVTTPLGKRVDRSFAVEVAAGPYEAYANGPPQRSDFFPVAVWVQEPSDAPAYGAMDVNTYVGLWQGPTQAQLDALAAAGMLAVAAQNDFAKDNLDHPVLVGWLQQDEPDNYQYDSTCDCYVDPIPPQEMLVRYQGMKQVDATRPVFLNLGQAVAHPDDGWGGSPTSGATDPDVYTAYLAAADVGSFDYYPVAGSYPADKTVIHFDWVPSGVQRMGEWVQHARPIGNVIETTRIAGNTPPTPDEVELEVWLSLIEGSRWLTYFCHEFAPNNHNALLDHPEMKARVAAINAEIRALARVLNAPEQTGLVQLSSSNPNVPVRSLVKADGDRIYVFLSSLGGGTTEVELRMPPLPVETWRAEDLASGTGALFTGAFTTTLTDVSVRRLAFSRAP